MNARVKILALSLLLLPLLISRHGPPVSTSTPKAKITKGARPLHPSIVSRGDGPLPYDFKQQLAYAATLPFEDRTALLQSLVDAIQPGAFGAALVQADGESDLQLRLIQRWAEVDSASAAQAIALLHNDDTIEATTRIARTWSRTDADESARWARNLGSNRDSALSAIANEVASTKPKQALDLLDEIPYSQENDIVLTTVASVDLDAAVGWAQKHDVLHVIAANIADRDPVAATKLLLAQADLAPEQQNLLFGIVQRYGAKDLSAATRWVQDFPEALREPALKELRRVSERSVSSVVR